MAPGLSCSSAVVNSAPAAQNRVEDSVRLLTDKIADDISASGPIAWLRYFEASPVFFMASDGQLVFENIDSATHFIETVLVKSIPKISLHFTGVRIDSLSPKVASIGAHFKENMTQSNGQQLSFSGFFTAVAVQTLQGWKLRNAHWSIKKG